QVRKSRFQTRRFPGFSGSFGVIRSEGWERPTTNIERPTSKVALGWSSAFRLSPSKLKLGLQPTRFFRPFRVIRSDSEWGSGHRVTESTEKPGRAALPCRAEVAKAGVAPVGTG